MKKPYRLLLAGLIGAALLAIVPAAVVGAQGAGGVTGPAFYVDGELYRTVGTPTDLFRTRAPDHSFDIIYEFNGVQTNVAEAAPGDPDYNGGRWRVHLLSFSDYAGALADDAVDMNDNDVLDSVEEVQAAITGSYANDEGVVKSFVCPAIPLPDGR